MGRTDDVLNVAGHRLSTGSIEQRWPATGRRRVRGHRRARRLQSQIPRALVVVKSGVDVEADGDRIRKEVVDRVRSEVGAVASLRRVDIVAAPSQDAIEQDPAQDDAGDRRRPRASRAGHHRGRRVLDRLAPVLRPHG